MESSEPEKVMCVDETDNESILKRFTDANIQFSAKLYQELIKTNSNALLVCPLSAQLILLLLHAGANGTTAEQIATGLSLPNDSALIKSMVEEVTSTFKTEYYYTINTANKIFVSKDFEIRDDFVLAGVETFKTGVENIDFGEKDKAAQIINEWVEEKTKHTVCDTVSMDDFEDALKLVLVDTLYLELNWMNHFKVEATTKKNFYVDEHVTIEVDMIKDFDTYEYIECEDLNAKFVQLEYTAPDLCMIIVLPNEKDGLAALEDHIGDVLKQRNFTMYEVTIELPKFKVDTTIKLNPIFQALGIEDAFTTDADLTGISDDENLHVSLAVQKNHTEISEKGTVDFIISDLQICLDMTSLGYEKKDFVADHPFIYYIKSKAGIIFIGKYNGE